jgi:hypothetical protein
MTWYIKADMLGPPVKEAVYCALCGTPVLWREPYLVREAIDGLSPVLHVECMSDYARDYQEPTGVPVIYQIDPHAPVSQEEIEQGWIVCSWEDEFTKRSNRWFAACSDLGVPFVKVVPGRVYGEVTSDMITTDAMSLPNIIEPLRKLWEEWGRLGYLSGQAELSYGSEIIRCMGIRCSGLEAVATALCPVLKDDRYRTADTNQGYELWNQHGQESS